VAGDGAESNHGEGGDEGELLRATIAEDGSVDNGAKELRAEVLDRAKRTINKVGLKSKGEGTGSSIKGSDDEAARGALEGSRASLPASSDDTSGGSGRTREPMSRKGKRARKWRATR